MQVVTEQQRAWAASGAMALTGRSDGPPLVPPDGVVDRIRHLGIPLGVDPLPLLAERAAIGGLHRQGAVSCGGSTRLLRAADGWVAVSLARESDLTAVPAWLELDIGDLGDLDTDGPRDLWLVVQEAVAVMPVATIVERGMLLDLPVAALPPPPERPDAQPDQAGPHPTSADRDCYVPAQAPSPMPALPGSDPTVHHPPSLDASATGEPDRTTGQEPSPTPPPHSTAQMRVASPAAPGPTVTTGARAAAGPTATTGPTGATGPVATGAGTTGTDAVTADRSPVGGQGGAGLPVGVERVGDSDGTGVGRAPLVVDLSSLWAGPLCARLLGERGARVVKVESVRRPDGARSGPPAFFDLMHHGHEMVALDFGDPADVAHLRRLLEAADVVIEASRPRALEQLGIDAAQLLRHGRGPSVWVSITGYGRSGPGRNRVAFGDDAAVAGGLVAWDGEGPCFVADAVADPLTGVTAAAAATEALATGGRWLLDVALTRVAAFVAAGTGGHPWQPGHEADAAPPQAPTAPGPAGSLGADTASVLGRLR